MRWKNIPFVPCTIPETGLQTTTTNVTVEEQGLYHIVIKATVQHGH